MRFLFLLTLLFSSASAQDIPLGSWRTHFSYDRTLLAEATRTQVFAAADVGLFSVDRSTGEVVKYSTADGLQGVDISALAYDPVTAILAVGYRSGNLDLISGGGILNLDLVTSSQVVGPKTIRDLEFAGSRIYAATDYGMLEIDIQTGDVRATYRELGQGADQIAVRDLEFSPDSIYLVTENGWQAAGADGADLADFRNWSYSPPAPGLIAVESVGTSLYFLSADTLYSNDSGVLQAIRSEGGYRGMSAAGQELLLYSPDKIERISASGSSTGIITDPLFSNINAVEVDPEGNTWVADDRGGLLADSGGSFRSFAPSGPVRSDMFEVTYTGGEIVALPGGLNTANLPLGREGAWSVFNNGLWENYEPSVSGFNDIVDAVMQDDRIILASAGNGLLEIIDGETIRFDESNSPLRPDSEGRVIIADLEERNDILFILNYASPSPLLARAGSEWQTYDGFPPIAAFAAGMTLTGNVAWLRISPLRGGGLLAYDTENGNTRFLTEQADQGSLASRTIFDMERDRDGFLWIGTARGVSLLFNPTDLDGAINAIEPVFEGRPLLVDRSVYAIATDGGNRKWMGTDQGVWLFDPLADELIVHFTRENSPLPSDVVLDIAIDERSGEVFFLTDEGMASFRADATSAGREHSGVRIFPNPVTRTFQGEVAISGLSRDANIKITDVRGRLIYQTQANGGTAVWPIRSSGVSATGMYLVFSASEDGEETYVGKIAVIE